MLLLTTAVGYVNLGSGLPALVHRSESGCSWHQVTIGASAGFSALAEGDAEGDAARFPTGTPPSTLGAGFPLLQAAVSSSAAADTGRR
ncbi:hypothetical protein [Streptomyces camelliae]|uniref:Uncharacterized protein n=1 Tax=Streptomyces camelliae TaxID=3004093 RepID=A0ABY7PEE1_9ACTN|nr:hypothetical protein [Streptomyces sp. HUAS 2-6]WBO68990.1 hypothetical protein O1G22_42600 [Streptomyces sp. HUAS 2-6]